MKDAAEIGASAMMCIPSFIKIGLIVQKLMGEGRFTDSQRGNLISLLFFQNFIFWPTFLILKKLK
jgi:hypothetical protein